MEDNQASSNKVRFDKGTMVGLAILLIGFFIIWPMIQQKLIEKPAPDVKYVTLNGYEGSIFELQSKPVLLHFWATWCSVCLVELPNIKKLEQNFTVLNIAMQSGGDAKVMEYALQHQMDMSKIVNDQSGRFAEAFSVQGVPKSIVVDSCIFRRI